MSRTKRRNKQHLIDSFVGTRDECLRDPWWKNWYADNLTPQQAYERRCHWYTRDHRSGRFGVPRWYRHEHGAHAMRRLENRALHKHVREDSLDNHLPDSRMRNSAYYWWY